MTGKIIGVIWFIILGAPASILMYKLSVYLYETEFQEWWVAIIWAVVFPATSTIYILNKKSKSKIKQ